MFSKFSSVVIFLITVTACSQQHSLVQERQRTTPPQNAQDVGTILEGAKPEQVESILAAHPEAKVRVLNPQHGMYEIFNVDHEQIAHEFNGDVSRNQYFDFHDKKPEFNLLSQPGPEGQKVGNLNKCAANPAKGGPQAVLAMTTPSGSPDTVDINTKVTVSGAKSQGAVKMAIVTHYPDSAPQQQVITNGSSVTISTPYLGLYQVFLMVQDGSDVCAVDAMEFVVTANRPYNGPNVPKVTADLSKFTHLAQVNAQQAWQISNGDGIVIAIVDTGVDYNHPSLAPNIVINKNEIPNNGIDDDHNGFVDDVIGYDLVNNDAFPYDDDSHGTHVAGLAASKQFGIARNAKILPVKALSPVGGDAGTIAAAVRYAVDRGANIVNLSLGGAAPAPHPAMVAAANYAEKKGVLLVIAAGNGDEQTGKGYSIDEQPYYPASLRNPNKLVVAASDTKDSLTSYSNFGVKSVDVVAPGGGENDMIYSCAYENPHGALIVGMAGTSMATPIVSGIAALVMSKNPGIDFQQVKEILMNAGQTDPNLTSVVGSGRHIDAYSALQQSAAHTVLN